MMSKILLASLLIIFSLTSSALGLHEAEQLALQRADELRQYENKHQALEAQAIAAGQLPDPSLNIAALNLPVNSFSLSQEAMTQIQLGIQQAFPKGHSLKYQYLNLHNQSLAAKFQQELQKTMILKTLREQWNLLYFWQKSLQILQKQRRTFKQLEKVTRSLFANNKVPQKDVLNAQLQLSQVDERLIDAQQSIETTQAELARWIGKEATRRLNAASLATKGQPESKDRLQEKLACHPILKAERADIAAARDKIQLSRQDYLPGFNAGLAYGFRQGRENITGRKRPDFLTGVLTFSVPLFPESRQDKKLLATHKELCALIEKHHASYKELYKQLTKNWIDYQKSEKKLMLYKNKLLPEAKQYASSTLIAYQNNQSDYINVAQSHIYLLNLQLSALKEEINQSQAQINLLYLQGR